MIKRGKYLIGPTPFIIILVLHLSAPSWGQTEHSYEPLRNRSRQFRMEKGTRIFKEPALRMALVQMADEFCRLAASDSSSEMQAQALNDAARLYAMAASPYHEYPNNATEVEVFRMTGEPGSIWQAYLDTCAKHISCFPDGINSLEATEPIWDPLRFPGAKFLTNEEASEFAKPALSLYRESTNPIVRTLAGALVARLMINTDWEMACTIAARVHQFEKTARPTNWTEAMRLGGAMMQLEEEFGHALGAWEDIIREAVAIRCTGDEGCPDEAQLMDRDGLWQIAVENYEEACTNASQERACFNVRHKCELTRDLNVSRCHSIPGLRVQCILSDTQVRGPIHERLVFVASLWEGFEVVYERGLYQRSPWQIRAHQRATEFPGQN